MRVEFMIDVTGDRKMDVKPTLAACAIGVEDRSWGGIKNLYR